MESNLDKQLEQILGKAVDGKDLELLYELDLKTLRELNSGQNEKFDRYVKHCVSIVDMNECIGLCDDSEEVQRMCREKQIQDAQIHNEETC